MSTHVLDTFMLAFIGLVVFLAGASITGMGLIPGSPYGGIVPLGIVVLLSGLVLLLQAWKQYYADRYSEVEKYRMINRTESERNRGSSDKAILEVAKKYGGILTPTVLVYEAALAFEKAQSELDRLVNQRVAFKRFGGRTYFYDVPDARTHLALADRQIIETLAMFNGKLNRLELIRRLGFPLEAVDESVLHLEQLGILTSKSAANGYELRGLEETSPNHVCRFCGRPVRSGITFFEKCGRSQE